MDQERSSLREALDRTILLMRTVLRPDVSDEDLVTALTRTEVALVADSSNLASHAAQSAYVTAAFLMARSGHTVHLIAPDLPLIGPQPPLPHGTAMLSGLREVDKDLLPSRRLKFANATHAIDLAVVFGNSDWTGNTGLIVRINAGSWAGEISRPSENVTPWRHSEWPLGGLAAADLAAAEAFKSAMRKLYAYAASPPLFERLVAPIGARAVFELAPEGALTGAGLRRFDIISGGAITHAALYSIARIYGVSGQARVIEPKMSDLPDSNRYMLLLGSRTGMSKAKDLEEQDLGGLRIAAVPLRYEPKNVAAIGALAPAVLVGVDDIPTRWEVQRANPPWLGVGGTEGFEVVVSFHENGLACAGCVHPQDQAEGGDVPTAAFVSFAAGLVLSSLFVRHAAGEILLAPAQLMRFCALRLDGYVYRGEATANPACPLTCARAVAAV